MTSNKKKKTTNPNVIGKHRKTSKRDSSSDGNTKSPTSSTATKPNYIVHIETKKSSPPWQVLGKKDMITHVENEIARRERIRIGIDSPSAGNINNERQKADVSGSSQLMSTADRSMLGWKRFNPVTTPSGLIMIGAYLDKRLPPSLGVPEIAFLGRSNVGKSSLLNRLVSKAGGDSARVGKTPGATAAVNLYALLGQKRTGVKDAKPILGFADLPGFGYAKLSKEIKESVEKAAERYLGKRRELALGILLVDSRREPNSDDRAVLAALFDMGVPLIVVATKSDKLNVNEVEISMATIRDGLGLPDDQPLRISAVTGEGIKELWRIILDACEMRVEELKLSIEKGKDDGGVMRMALDDDNEGDDFFDDDDDDDDNNDEDYFDDGEDLVYNQGYDWVQGEGLADVAEIADEDFYDGGVYVENEDVKLNREKQQMEKESFSLKNLNQRVDAMERRGEI
jgi:GTP-binding protein